MVMKKYKLTNHVYGVYPYKTAHWTGTFILENQGEGRTS